MSLEEMEKLQGLVRNVFRYITDLKEKEKLAECIQYPKIPSDLSESAVVHLRSKLFEGSTGAKFGGRKADVLVQYPQIVKRVEVKATAVHGFEAFGDRDISADYLVWIHFGTFFRREGGEVSVYCLEDPARFFSKPVKISIPSFLETVNAGTLVKLSGSSLTEIVRRSGD